ncbi:hypothetical protein LCGC14_0606010 [marine sediment metagenome]|uniref:Bacteriophage Mu GpT domain-containing protein n=1 Tax=marine sediment metagenome TaxID=412755 RepID=A0A0F9RDY4_9ZZZZ
MLERLLTRAEPDQRRDMISRTITLRADTLDEAERSVEVVMSTEDKVTVFDWNRWGMIDEVLLSRGAELPEQIPLLETHRRYSIDDVLGSVRRMRIEGDQTMGRAYFARDDQRADASWNKVRQGHVDSVSVGYRSIEFTDIEPNTTKTVAGRQYKAGSRPLRITTRWQVKELSLVPIGADPRAKIREESPPIAKENQVNPKLRKYLEAIGLRTEATDEQIRAFMDALGGQQRQIVDVLAIEPGDDATKHLQRLSLEGLGVKADEPWKPLERQETPPANPPTPLERNDGPAPLNEEAIRQQAIADERTRVEMIRRVVGDDGDDEFVQRAISEGWNEERTSRETLTRMREDRTPAVGGIHPRSHETDCNARTLAAGLLIGQGLDPTKHSFHRGERTPRRADGFTEQEADHGDRFSRMPAIDLCRECIRMDGGRMSRDPEDTVRAAVSGTSLSSVFTTNVYARLMAAWETVGDTTNGWCDEEDVPNFLAQEEVTLEADAQLERLPSGDTAKHATASDSSETYKIARYAKQFVVDEQTIIDDRLGAIMRMPAEMGENARKLRPELVYALILENPTMTDTGAVFNDTAVTTTGGHANLTIAALGAEGLRAAITAMVVQRLGRTTTKPGDSLNIRPNYLIVPPDLEWTARALLSSANLIKLFADSADPLFAPINLIAQEGITLVIDSRIDAIGVTDPKTKTVRTGTATNWFLAEGGSRGLRVAYRRGTNRAPSVRSFVLTQGQWGLGWDINMDIGAAFTEYRTWHKSTGAG